MNYSILKVVTPEYCSASICIGPKRSTAEASLIGDQWWVNRVIVNPASKRDSGIGTSLLTKLKELVKENGGKALLVSPGGYDSDLTLQERFYAKNGFVETDDKGLWKVVL